MVGKTISHYKILEELGRGGMGVVYRAEDTKLKRTVAIKILPADLMRDPETVERLMHEAQAASALNHQNICSMHAIEEFEGQQFLDMEFVEGKTLADMIKTKETSLARVLDFAVQIAEGLNAAHKKGIVHRDIKPDNIMLTDEGLVKIMDFGLAKWKGASKLTKTHTTLGTLSYMSPEQARGEDVDERSDIFSFGTVFYEMVTGQRPFKGEHEAAILYSLANEAPEPMARYKSDVPIELQQIVDKALAKERSERYQHIADMLVDLRAFRSAMQNRMASDKAGTKGGKKKAVIALAAAGMVIVIALGMAIIPRIFKPAKPSQTLRGADSRKMIVVLPFENLGSPEDEYFANGTTDAITARLASVSGLGVISRQSAIQYKKTKKSIREIGRELDVDYILEGTVQREQPGNPASRVRVIPQLIRVADDTHVWADIYDKEMVEVFRVQSDIAERVATQLDVALLEPERRAMEKMPTENLAAYDNYLRGMEHYFNTENLSEAELSVKQLERAVSLDPQFAEAWAGLAMAYHNLYWVFDRPGTLTLETQAAKRAEDLEPDIQETHLALGYADYAHREFDKALAHFKTAQRLRASGEAARAVGFTLRRLGKWQEALIHFEEGCRLMPRSYSTYSDDLGFTNTALRRFDDAIQNLNQAILLSPHVTNAYVGKAHVLLSKNGDVNAGRQVLFEMSRRTNIAEAFEITIISGLVGTSTTVDTRLFPEIYVNVFNAFESGPMERFHRIQPAIVAASHLARAFLIEAQGGRQSAVARYDSARVHFERIIRSNPQSAYICAYHSDLGLAYAGLGRCGEAIREGEEAVRMMPISKDAFVGSYLLVYLAEIYVRCGEHEAAIDLLRTLLSMPSDMSVGLLRVDPVWNPLRTNTRFRRLVEGE